MKRMKRWGLRRLGGKRGFTLIELLIVMVILAILAGIVIISIGGVFGTAQERAYEGARDQVQVAVGDYMSRELGALPTTGGNVTLSDPAGTYAIIDMCKLQMAYNVTPPGPGLLLEIPVSCANAVGDSNATGINCVNMGNCPGAGNCTAASHYIWVVTDAGDVMSTCVDSTDCTAVDKDEFQGIYP